MYHCCLYYSLQSGKGSISFQSSDELILFTLLILSSSRGQGTGGPCAQLYYQNQALGLALANPSDQPTHLILHEVTQKHTNKRTHKKQNCLLPIDFTATILTLEVPL